MTPEQATVTTEELQSKCEETTGLRPSVNQLGDWVEQGFLLQSKVGKGRGRVIGGWEARQWKMECLPRLIVIAGCRKEKNISIPCAAYALASAGYLIGAKPLRTALESCLQELQSSIMDPITWKRPFLDPKNRIPPEEQRQRLRRSDQKKYKYLDPALGQAVEAIQLNLLGLATSTNGNALDQMLDLFSYERISTSVKKASDADILQAFQEAGSVVPQLVPRGVPLLSLVYTAGLADAVTKDPPEWRGLQQALGDLVRLFTGEDPEALARKIRIPTTLVCLHVTMQGITNLPELASTAFQDIMTYIIRYTGEVGESIRTALQQALNKVDEQEDPTTVEADTPGTAEM